MISLSLNVPFAFSRYVFIQFCSSFSRFSFFRFHIFVSLLFLHLLFSSSLLLLPIVFFSLFQVFSFPNTPLTFPPSFSLPLFLSLFLFLLFSLLLLFSPFLLFLFFSARFSFCFYTF